MIIDECRAGLRESQSDSNYERVYEIYADDLLNYESFPDTHIDFIVELLSDEEFYKNSGVWYFLFDIGTDTDIMNNHQKNKILEAIVSNYNFYTDKQLILTACDFIARYYDCDIAETNLKKMAKIEIDKPEHLRGFSQDGLLIVENEKLRQRRNS